jgi:hypothetical protein
MLSKSLRKQTVELEYGRLPSTAYPVLRVKNAKVF